MNSLWQANLVLMKHNHGYQQYSFEAVLNIDET